MNFTLHFPRVKGYIVLLSANEARQLEPNPPEIGKAFVPDSVCTWVYTDGRWLAQDKLADMGVYMTSNISGDDITVSISYGKISSPSELARAVTMTHGIDFKLGESSTRSSETISELFDSLYRQTVILNDFDREQRLAEAPASFMGKIVRWLSTPPDKAELERPWIVLLVTLPNDAQLRLGEKSTYPGLFSSWPLLVSE